MRTIEMSSDITIKHRRLLRLCQNCEGDGTICRRCGRSFEQAADRCNGDEPHDFIDCPACKGEGSK